MAGSFVKDTHKGKVPDLMWQWSQHVLTS